MSGTRRYSEEFKDQAVQLIKEQGSILSVARETGVSYTQLARWLRKRTTGKSKQVKTADNI